MLAHRLKLTYLCLALPTLLVLPWLSAPALAEDEAAPPAGVLARFRGHGDLIYAVAFSADGRLLATGSFDKTIKLWETATGKEVMTLDGPAGHQSSILSVAFSRDGQTLASGALDNTAKLWKATAASPTQTLAHAAYVDAVAFNPAGTQLATASHDGTVRVWDVAKGQALRQISAHAKPSPAPVYCLAWSPDGKHLVSGSLDRSLKLWDAASGSPVREFKAYKEKEFPRGHQDAVFCAAFSPDGKLLASGGSDRLLKIWNVADGSVVRECVNPGLTPAPPAPAHPGWIYGVRFTPDGAALISAGHAPGNKGYLAVWRVADGKLLYGEEWPLGPIYALALSPDGKVLALGCGPRRRGSQEGDGYRLKVPGPGKQQAARAEK